MYVFLFLPSFTRLTSPFPPLHRFEDQSLSSSSTVTPSSSRGTTARGLSKRHLTYLSPRLGILHTIPFAIPFEVRVAIFRNFVRNDKQAHGAGRDVFGRFEGGNGRMRVSVRRGSVAQDGFDRLGEADLKKPVEIVFIDQFGEEE